jgi:hypothetical protein
VNYKSVILIISFIAFANQAQAQLGYQKDSLQIKVYAKMEYVNSRLRSVDITKIFCDYCSKLQLEKLKEEASRLAYLARNNKDYIQQNGTKKLAMYIRVSKKDFAALKEEKIDN